MLYPLEGGDPQPIPGLVQGETPMRWSGDGEWLYVRKGQLPVQVTRIHVPTGRREPWHEIQPADTAGVPGVQMILPTPDGDGYVYTYMRQLSELYLVTGLL